LTQNALQIGRIGEFIAAAAVEQLGMDAILVSGKKYDLLVTKEDRIYRVQVKATSRPNVSNRQTSKPLYEFRTAYGRLGKQTYSKGQVDIFALVALDIRKVVFLPASDIKKITTRIPPFWFDADDSEARSWDTSVKVFQEM
jgi:hypothetical protein